jgi:ABC-type branched-subunit amino acid transport system substrate-binding protein
MILFNSLSKAARTATLLITAALLVASCTLAPTRTPPQAPPRAPAQLPPRLPQTPVPPLSEDATATDLAPLMPPQAEAQRLRGAPPLLPPPPGATRAALLVPMSGKLAGLGTSMLRASQMAVFDVGEPGFEVAPYDTRGTPEGAERATRLALAEGAAVVLGPLLASSVRAVQPLATQAAVPVVAFSSDSRVAGGDVQIMGFVPENEVQRIIGFAAENGASTFGVLAPKDGYGEAVAAAAKAAAAARGTKITTIQLYDPDTKDFAPVLRKLTATASRAAAKPTPVPTAAAASPLPSAAAAPLPFNALLIADGGARLRAIADALPAHGLSAQMVQLLGTGAWDEAGLGIAESLQGGWFAAAAPAFRVAFEDRYRAHFGEPPPRLATLAYDATAVAALAARARAGGVALADTLADPNGFLGRDGLFRFSPAGIAERRLAVLAVEKGGVRVVSPAALSFAGS